MLAGARLPAVLVLALGLAIAGAPPAAAGVTGPCDMTFNGIDADRIDRLGSPLELEATDILLLEGTDPGGVSAAEIRLMVGPVGYASRSQVYAVPVQDFEVAVHLEPVSPWGIGLFRVVGATDGCLAEAWVRVSGRFPLATITGLLGIVLLFAGTTGQLGAIASRRRWPRSAAALGGVATGTGLALIGQQFGRLQISYFSLSLLWLFAGASGAGLAQLLNPGVRRARKVVPPRLPVSPLDLPPQADRAHRPRRDAGTTEPDPGPFWCHVTAPTAVFGLTDHSRTVATLEPGTWYLARRTMGGWVHVVSDEGEEGWVAQGAIRRHRE